jgi:hypothetical protein
VILPRVCGSVSSEGVRVVRTADRLVRHIQKREGMGVALSMFSIVASN